jgi:hypothetical protein
MASAPFLGFIKQNFARSFERSSVTTFSPDSPVSNTHDLFGNFHVHQVKASEIAAATVTAVHSISVHLLI